MRRVRRRYPDTHAELTVPLVHVRALLAGLRLEPTSARRALDLAREIYWAERSWRLLRAAWREGGLDPALIAATDAENERPVHHPKFRDARLAVACVLGRPFGAEAPGDLRP